MPDMDTIVSLAKRRGFVFQSSEIYGGLASTYDYGPLGVELKRNIKEAWWRTFIHQRDDMVGLDAAILMAPQVWVASGHLGGFADPLVECKTCHHRFRADQLEATVCPDCGGELTEPRQFNLMFKTFIGPVEDEASVAYLRPETAQGIFVNFANVLNATRRKLPFGIGQIGKSFRNEITVGNFIFRTREFEQMEIEFFVKPPEAVKPGELTDEEWHRNWVQDYLDWFESLGIPRDQFRVRPHDADELSHYSKATHDIEYNFPWGFGELMGVANRTDFDLKAHSKASGVDLTYFDEESGKHITPYVVEPALGVDRAVLIFLLDAYREEAARTAGDKTEKRVLLKLHPALAPVKVAILPLSRNERLVPKAREVYHLVRPHFVTQYDDAQSIGRRYRRQDEIGTPLCVTVDFDTLDADNAVTIRDRDTMEQVRLPIPDLLPALRDRLP